MERNQIVREKYYLWQNHNAYLIWKVHLDNLLNSTLNANSGPSEFLCVTPDDTAHYAGSFAHGIVVLTVALEPSHAAR